jgi:cytochrome P450
MFALLRNPEQLGRLRADPFGLPAAIEEFLRYDAPVATATFRFTREQIRIGEASIPPGEIVNVVLAAANRDPRRFAEPARLDTARHVGAHLAFGHGIHFCLGASLARMEAQIAFEALLGRLPDLALAVPAENLGYRPVTMMHGLQTLPVTFTAVAPNG